MKVGCRFSAGEIEVALPRSTLLNFEPGRGLDFKWADNIQQDGQAPDFTLHGDCAPNDRFNYRARYEPVAKPR